MEKLSLKIRLLAIPLSIVLIFFLCNCSNQGKPSGETGTGKVSEEPFFKTLLVIGDDRSGSTSDIRKFTREDYQLVFETIGAKGGGAVAVCLVGNPQPQSREPYVLVLKPLENIVPFDPRNQKLTLTEKGQIKIRNEKIQSGNLETLKTQKTDIAKYLDAKINPSVIVYSPSGKDQTDLDDAISRINTLIHEPQYKDYNKIIVAMISDGKNQPDNQPPRPVTFKIEHPSAEFYLVGWEETITCFNGLQVNVLSSKDGLIEIIKNLKIN